jgi:DNA-binding winged helix-turn-helix (wHTH) protein
VRIRFGPFILDLDTRQLTRGSREIHLEPKAFDLHAAALMRDRPKVLSKAALQERLWPATFVAEANLSNLVAEVREALGDPARTPRYIRTAHGVGYAFCGDAAVTGPRDRAAESPSCWLEWDGQRLPLSVGEHVIGRTPTSRSGSNNQPFPAARAAPGDGKEPCSGVRPQDGTFLGSEPSLAPVQPPIAMPYALDRSLMTFPHVLPHVGGRAAGS